MTFSLKTLLLVAAVAPPLLWLLFSWLSHPNDPERPLTMPDPVLLLGTAAWIAIYYNLVHKRLTARL